MAVIHSGIWWTIQLGAIHSVYGGDYSVKTGTEVTYVPHPLKHWRDVNVCRAEAKHRE